MLFRSTVNLSGNPLECDCQNADLALHLRNALNSSVTTWFTYQPDTGPRCAVSGESLKSVDLTDLTCPLEDCPEACNCTYAPYTKDLQGRISMGCQALPHFIANVTADNVGYVELNLSHLALAHVDDLMVIPGMKTLTGLDLSYNNLTLVPNIPSNIVNLALDHNLIPVVDKAFLLSRLWQSLQLAYNPYQ